MQLPFHKSILRPVFFAKYAPRFLSGENRIGLSFGIWLMIFSALLDVQIISLRAFTSAEQLMYVIATWSGCISRNLLKSGAGHPSASEQPASRSGSKTNLSGLRIFAVSAIK